MHQVPIKLGPLALLLTIISICLTTLSILTFTTSGADLRLAQKYADTVQIRYELEQEGQAFLQEASHTSRLIMDEEGITAASYVDFAAGAALPPQEEIDIVFDRPFFFGDCDIDTHKPAEDLIFLCKQISQC